MQHIYTEDELILNYYGELDSELAIDLGKALECDPVLAKQYSNLCKLLNSFNLAEKNPSEHVLNKLFHNLEEHEPTL